MSRCWKCGRDIPNDIIICDQCMDKISSFDPMTCTIDELIAHWMQYTQSEIIWNEVRDAIYQRGRSDAIEECKTILKTKHMIRTTEDDFCAKVEIPFYKGLWERFEQLKEQNNG